MDFIKLKLQVKNPDTEAKITEELSVFRECTSRTRCLCCEIVLGNSYLAWMCEEKSLH